MQHNMISYRDSDIFQKVFEESSNLQSYTCSLGVFNLLVLIWKWLIHKESIWYNANASIQNLKYFIGSTASVVVGAFNYTPPIM